MSTIAFLKKLWRTFPRVLSTVSKLLPSRPLSRLTFIKPMIFFLQLPTLVGSSQPQSSKYDVEENVSHLMTLARIALEKGDHERASAILEMGIKICEEYEVHVALPYMYDVLASISFALGNMEKAESLLVVALEKMMQVGVAEDDSQVVDFQLRLARIYSAYDKQDLADIGFKDCLNKQKRKILDGDTSTKTGMLYVNVLFWYGLHKIRSNEHKLAKELITSAYDFSLKIKGLSPYQEMVILYTLADLHMQLGDNSLALQNMNSAILLGKGIGSIDMPKCYLKQAQIYLNLNAFDKAKQACEEALNMATLFNDHVIVGEAENLLGKIRMQCYE